MAKAENPADAISETLFPDHTVIVPPHRLRGAVRQSGDSMEIDIGAGRDAIARAGTALDEIKGEFHSWMIDECEAMEAARAALHREGPTPQAFAALFTAAHDIRGHAAVFGYPLAGMIAGTLCRLIGECPPEQIPLPLIDRHADAIRAIVREAIRQLDDITASETARRLADITDAHLAQYARQATKPKEETAALPRIPSPKL